MRAIAAVTETACAHQEIFTDLTGELLLPLRTQLAAVGRLRAPWRLARLRVRALRWVSELSKVLLCRFRLSSLPSPARGSAGLARAGRMGRGVALEESFFLAHLLQRLERQLC